MITDQGSEPEMCNGVYIFEKKVLNISSMTLDYPLLSPMCYIFHFKMIAFCSKIEKKIIGDYFHLSKHGAMS